MKIENGIRRGARATIPQGLKPSRTAPSFPTAKAVGFHGAGGMDPRRSRDPRHPDIEKTIPKSRSFATLRMTIVKMTIVKMTIVKMTIVKTTIVKRNWWRTQKRSAPGYPIVCPIHHTGIILKGVSNNGCAHTYSR